MHMYYVTMCCLEIQSKTREMMSCFCVFCVDILHMGYYGGLRKSVKSSYFRSVCWSTHQLWTSHLNLEMSPGVFYVRQY